MKIVRLTDEEVAALRATLDLALKQIGRQFVPTFATLDQKLQNAVTEPEPNKLKAVE